MEEVAQELGDLELVSKDLSIWGLKKFLRYEKNQQGRSVLVDSE